MAKVTAGFVSALRAAGLDVVEMPGWQDRGESGSFNIRGLLLHHDAMGLHNDNVPHFMSQNGENGAQLWVKYTGQVYVLAAGLKWHAGAGGGFRNIPAGNGNAYCLGVETDYKGSGPRESAIDEAIHKLTRVAVQFYGMNPQRDLACHREYAPDRKIDLANFDADAWRARAASDAPAPRPAPTQTPTDTGELTMADVATILAAIDALSKKVDASTGAITKYIEDGVVFRIRQLAGDNAAQTPTITKYIEDGVVFRLEELKAEVAALAPKA